MPITRFASTNEDNIDDWHVMERHFHRKKNRSKSWVFRCKNCKEKVDDTVNQSYWVRFDTGEIYFCSKECALNYRTNSNQI